MKIAFVTQPWDIVAKSADASSSIAILTYQFASHLAKSADITIYSRRGPNQAATERDEQGIQYRRFPVKLEELGLRPFKVADRVINSPERKRPLFASRFYYIGYALQVARDLRKQQFDIVHVSNFSQFIPLFRRFSPKSKLALHMHCEWLNQVDADLIGPRLEASDRILGCSNYITQKIRDEYVQEADKCVTMYNGVDIDRFAGRQERSGDRTKRILFVARVSPEKGVHVLVDAFSRIVREWPNTHLDIIGPAASVPYEFVVGLSDDEQVSELAAFYSSRTVTSSGESDYLPYLQAQMTPDVARKVTFHGFVPHSTITDYYRDADVFVYPSVWDEPFGMPLIEAMASELPVVATKGGGITEVVNDGETGYLVEKGDARELAEAISKLLGNDSLRLSMGRAGRQRAYDSFSWEIVSKDLMNTFDGMTHSGRASSQTIDNL